MNLVYNAKQQPVLLENIYAGASCFFIGAGPSLNQIDLSIFQQRGLITFAVNNIAARDIRPNIWLGIDVPKSFHANIWNDPAILKFTKTENWDHGYNGGMVNNAPNLFWFKADTKFDTNTFFKSESISLGRSKDSPDNLGISGGRSIMLPAFRLMHYLGFKRIFLLGCDFNMQPDKPYAFEQTKWAGGVKTNNQMYEIISKRLASLKPQLKEFGIRVFNCTLNSMLTIFPEMPLEEAIYVSRKGFVDKPNLKSMYGESH